MGEDYELFASNTGRGLLLNREYNNIGRESPYLYTVANLTIRYFPMFMYDAHLPTVVLEKVAL